MRRAVVPLLALTVGFVLADSAVVTLALPDILAAPGRHRCPGRWVLIAFNLVLMLSRGAGCVALCAPQTGAAVRGRHRRVRRGIGGRARWPVRCRY